MQCSAVWTNTLEKSIYLVLKEEWQWSLVFCGSGIFGNNLKFSELLLHKLMAGFVCCDLVGSGLKNGEGRPIVCKIDCTVHCLLCFTLYIVQWAEPRKHGNVQFTV